MGAATCVACIYISSPSTSYHSLPAPEHCQCSSIIREDHSGHPQRTTKARADRWQTPYCRCTCPSNYAVACGLNGLAHRQSEANPLTSYHRAGSLPSDLSVPEHESEISSYLWMMVYLPLLIPYYNHYIQGHSSTMSCSRSCCLLHSR